MRTIPNSGKLVKSQIGRMLELMRSGRSYKLGELAKIAKDDLTRISYQEEREEMIKEEYGY